MNDGESTESFRARAELLKKKHGNGNGAGMPLAVAVKDTWPTPDAQVMGDRDLVETYEARRAGSNRSVPLALVVKQVSRGAWATPRSTDGSNGGPGQVNGRGQVDSLLGQVAQNWPTPRAAEWKGVGPLGSESQAYRLEKGYLDATVQAAEARTGRLNPDWVEHLMGWPAGWSGLPTAVFGRMAKAQRRLGGKRRAQLRRGTRSASAD